MVMNLFWMSAGKMVGAVLTRMWMWMWFYGRGEEVGRGLVGLRSQGANYQPPRRSKPRGCGEWAVIGGYEMEGRTLYFISPLILCCSDSLDAFLRGLPRALLIGCLFILAFGSQAAASSSYIL